MRQAFLIAGLASVIAAVVGGGLKAFGIEIPVLSSRTRQTILGLLGVILIGAAILNQGPSRSDQDCVQGYVWRQAIPDDRVCVTMETHLQTLADNQLAGSRRDPAGGPYGPDQCLKGYVWREAFSHDDHVCVSPQTRQQAAEDNQEAPRRVKR
jgi:hypothetical protein